MAQITIPRLPQAPEEYSATQINQMIQTLDQLINLLNSSYTPEQLKNEDEALSWFLA
jgi:dsDNA-binding SOS-regulon protein